MSTGMAVIIVDFLVIVFLVIHLVYKALDEAPIEDEQLPKDEGRE